MIPIYCKRFNYTLKYNPKSGCTLYRRIFLALHEEELGNREGVSHHNLHEHFQVPSTLPEGHLSMTIVRNPFPRVVSAYLDKCCEILVPDTRRFGLDPLLQSIHLPIFKFLNRPPDFKRGFTFREFLFYVSSMLSMAKPKINEHFSPQARPSDEFDFFHRLEDGFEDSLEKFCKLLRGDEAKIELMKETHLAHEKKPMLINQTYSKDRPVYKPERRLCDWSFEELRDKSQEGYRLDYADFYSEEARALVEHIFDLDLKLFDYSYPY